MSASTIANPAIQLDLSSSIQVSSSTHPWKNAFPVTLSRQDDGNGCRIII